MDLMQIGDKQWLEKANKVLTFPCIIAFMVKPNGAVCCHKVKSDAHDTYNVKWGKIGSYGDYAVISVKHIETIAEYAHECKRFTDIWKHKKGVQ
jgi:hypothetical protein